ncbi:uncharacterized protein [Amphiura filiformis]|uniref:uncharacterized protein isoform X1 n=1 Tax=Amphiura filiformis TaxID=82378 RepID=UPI003B20DA34
MSSIRFAGEGENAGAGSSRSRRKRRTSILKAPSPSRTALGDLDPNAAEQQKLDAKSKRRSSKRVSFADTMHVQEFWTEHHAKELGLWDTSHDSVAGLQHGTQKNQENVNAPDVQSSVEPRSEDQSQQTNASTSDQQEQVPDDSPEKTGHKISGLETLLTGQIRNTPPESEELSTASEPPQPTHVQELSSSSTTVNIPPSAAPSSISQECDNNDIKEQQIEQFEIQFTETCSESTVKEANKSVSKKHSRRSLTLVGAPSYLRRMPSNNDSTMSVSMDPQHWAIAQQSNLNLSQGTGDMDLTATNLSLTHPESFVHDESVHEQTDNQSFFQQFLGSKKPAALSWQGVDAPVEDDVFTDEDSPEGEKTDNKIFFQQLMSRTSIETNNHMQKEVTSSCNSPAQKLDNRSFFSTLMGSSSSQQKANISSMTTLNKTAMFGEDEATGGMEFTTCIGGMLPNQATNQVSNQASLRRKPLGERIEALANSSEMTIRFGGHNNEGDMEMTACYSGNQQSGGLPSSSKQPLSMKADATQIFNQSGAMEMTTCIGGITGNDRTRFTNVSGLTFMNKTYTDVTLNNTSAVMREIDSALGLKRKSDVPADSMQEAHKQKVRRSEAPTHESTRVFSGTYVHTGVTDANNSKAPLALSPIRKDPNDVNQCGEETAAIELTGCIGNIQQRRSSSSAPPVESTRILQAEDTAGMKFTTCVGSELSQLERHNATKQPLEGDRTRVFTAEDSGDMEMTECHSVVVTSKTPSSSSSATSKLATGQDRTKVFQPDETCGMELTTCVDNLIGKNTDIASQESTHSLSVMQHSKAPNDMDKTKIFLSDDTCGMEFTTCVGNLLPNSQNTSVRRENKNRTRTFSEEADNMEMTECMDSFVSARNASSDTSAKAPNPDVTKGFSDNAAKMELTGNVNTSLGSISHSKTPLATSISHRKKEERTRVFTDDAGGIEMTECIGGLISDSKHILKQNDKTPKDHTRLFMSENTAKMDLTECVGRMYPDFTCPEAEQPVSSTGKSESKADRTKMFSDLTARMDMTECDGRIFQSIFNGKESNLPTDNEHTRVFSDETAGMEMTQCVGNVSIGCNSIAAGKEENKGAASESTRVFSEETGKMDMTECIGTAFASHPGLTSAKKANVSTLNDNPPDQTKIFSEDTCRMEMTECVGNAFPSFASHPGLSSAKKANVSIQKETLPDQTKIFSEDTCRMEMTECVGAAFPTFASHPGLSSAKKANVSTLNDNAPDQTKIFSEDTCRMEMTECVGNAFPSFASHPGLASAKKGNVSIQKENLPDQTKIFSEDTCRMEMTECVGNAFPSFASHPGLSSAKKANVSIQKENLPDQTKIFSDDTCRMEMTECVGAAFPSFASHPGLSSAKKANVSTLNDNPPDQTKIFSEDTCRMEMTECVGNAFPSFASHPGLSSAKKANVSIQKENLPDQTKIFSEDTCRMEMTECIGNAFPSFASHPGLSSAKKANVSIQKENLPDQTKIFSEDTCRMEMTECIGNAFPSFASHPGLSSAKKANVSIQKENLPDQTKIFSEDTCRMEMTECVSGSFPSFAPKVYTKHADDKENNVPISSIASRSNQSLASGIETSECGESEEMLRLRLSTIAEEKSMRENNESMVQMNRSSNQTQMFSGKDCGMELTECVGISDILRDGPTRNMAAGAGGATKIFSEHTAMMDMTECVGGESVGIVENVVNKTGSDELVGEHTKVFSENTARMDMTECVSGVLSTASGGKMDDKCLNGSVSEKKKEEIIIEGAETDSTKIFSEYTAKMEMTACIGGVLDGSIKAVDTVNRLNSEKEHLGEQTKVFSDNTAKMDMTECVSGMLSTSADDRNHSAIATCQQVDRKRVADDVVNEETVEEKRRSDTFTLDTTKVEASAQDVGNETKRSSDTFTITKNSSTPPSNDDEQNLKDGELRRSDTFTLDKAVAQTKASGEIQSAMMQDLSKSKEGAPTNEEERHGSAESYSGDGIMEEETLEMDNTGDIMCYSDLFKKGLKDVTIMDTNLSMDIPVFQSVSSQKNDTLDDSVFRTRSLTSAPSSTSSGSSSSFSQSASESFLPRPRLSQADISALDPPISESHTLPTSGPVQIEEFLDFLAISSTIPKGRRSIMHQPVSLGQPETLGDQLQLNLITQPKHQMYEWANDYLTSSIEKMREIIGEQEERLSKENPDIVKELQHATPERSQELRKMVVSLQDGCKKSTQKMFKEWRKKITSSTLESLKKSQEELESGVSVVCSSTEKIEESLQGLEQYDGELDTALGQVDSTTLPTAEEQGKYQAEKELLDRITEEVEQLKEMIPALEKQKGDLRKEMETLQATHCAMELEAEQLACVSKSPEFNKAEAVDKINRIHRLQEWKLEEYKHNGCRVCFTFLEGSIRLTFNLGNKVGSEEDNIREITGVSYESLLAGDACIAAKVANTMALKSVDIETLRRTITTTKNFPQVLQQLSTKLCPARLMYDEVDSIAFWHPLTFSESKLTVEFSHLKAYLKFYVTFELVPGTYPMKALRHTYRHKIGQNVEREVEAALSSVKPGWNYLSRLTSTIEEIIQSKIPKQQGY